MDYISLFLQSWKATVFAVIFIIIFIFLFYFGYILKQNSDLKNTIGQIKQINIVQQNITKNIANEALIAEKNQKYIFKKQNEAINSLENINNIDTINCEFNNFNNLSKIC